MVGGKEVRLLISYNYSQKLSCNYWSICMKSNIVSKGA